MDSGKKNLLVKDQIITLIRSRKMIKKYGEAVSKRNPDILANAYEHLETSLKSAQNPVALDTVSGATLSSYRFQIAVLKAIYEASSKHNLNTDKYTEGPALMNAAGKGPAHD